jgi:hypothetical protein
MMGDERIRQLLENLPEREPRSRLEPFRELIVRMREKGYSYREISRYLVERCGVEITHNAVRNFLKRHGAADGQALPPHGADAQRPWNADTPRLSKTATVEEPSRVRERIEALKRWRAPEETPVADFRFDAAQPLRLPDE